MLTICEHRVQEAGLIMAKHAEEYKPLEEGKKAEVEELLKTLMKPEDRQ